MPNVAQQAAIKISTSSEDEDVSVPASGSGEDSEGESVAASSSSDGSIQLAAPPAKVLKRAPKRDWVFHNRSGMLHTISESHTALLACGRRLTKMFTSATAADLDAMRPECQACRRISG